MRKPIRFQLQGSRTLKSWFLLIPLSIISFAGAQTGHWFSFPDTAAVIPREECAFAQAGGKFYLLGGRGKSAVQEYSPGAKTWKNLKVVPSILNHFQAISSSGLIYVICAFDESAAGYPKETPAPFVYIYDPLSDTWVKGPAIPAARLRGSAGAVEYQGKFYLVVGNKLGHTGPGALFLDEFDPATNVWKTLPDAPRSRDHFEAAMVNGKIYALGGRQSDSTKAVYTNLEKVDVYDIAAGAWSTLPSPDSDMKIKRSGGIVAPLGNDILYAGGSNPGVLANAPYNLVDAFNTVTNTWRSLAPMKVARQVTGGFINNSALYVASGSGGVGGTPTLKSMEAFYLSDSLPPSGEALVAGALSPATTLFNFGIVANGQESRQQFALRHASGNQGVLISGLKVVGDAAFQVKMVVTAPYLVRPGGQSLVDLSFTSKGTAPTDTYLEITLAVPPGVTVKVPLDANRVPISISAARPKAAAAAPVRFWKGSWLFPGPQGGEEDAAAPRIFRSALGQRR
ncbi:MAG: Kelch repeat-containing protein [Fibrobacteres bacterium]|nr:Kelch repeat-containing protein [Fibrobacterota bacterium]